MKKTILAIILILVLPFVSAGAVCQSRGGMSINAQPNYGAKDPIEATIILDLISGNNVGRTIDLYIQKGGVTITSGTGLTTQIFNSQMGQTTITLTGQISGDYVLLAKIRATNITTTRDINIKKKLFVELTVPATKFLGEDIRIITSIVDIDNPDIVIDVDSFILTAKMDDGMDVIISEATKYGGIIKGSDVPYAGLIIVTAIASDPKFMPHTSEDYIDVVDPEINLEITVDGKDRSELITDPPCISTNIPIVLKAIDGNNQIKIDEIHIIITYPSGDPNEISFREKGTANNYYYIGSEDFTLAGKPYYLEGHVVFYEGDISQKSLSKLTVNPEDCGIIPISWVKLVLYSLGIVVGVSVIIVIIVKIVKRPRAPRPRAPPPRPPPRPQQYPAQRF